MSDANEFPVHRGAFKAKKGLYVTGDALITGSLTLSGGLSYSSEEATGFAKLNVTETLSAVGDIYLGGADTNNIVIGTPGVPLTLLSGVSGDFLPALHQTYSLGTEFVKWSSGYFSNDIYWGTSGRSLDTFYSFIQNNSASWGSHTDVTDLTTTVSANSAEWANHTDVTDLTTTVSTNSASWGSGSGGSGGGGGGGSAGVFITNLTCGDNGNRNNGISQLTEDSDEIQIDSERPLTSALVDNSSVRIWCQWEGSASEWTGTPTISGHEILRANTTAIAGNYARRFEGYIDLDLDDYTGQNNTITYSYEGLDKTFDLEIAGGGPEVTNVEFTSTAQHSQDHYKDGDSVTFVIEFNGTDVTTISLDGGNDTATQSLTNHSVTMNGVSATVTTNIDTTLSSIQSRPVKITAKNSLGTEGPETNSSDFGEEVDVMNGPVIVNVTWNAGTIYPNQQVEFADGDNFTITEIEFDTTNVDKVQFEGNGNNSFACDSSLRTVTVNSSKLASNIIVGIDTSLTHANAEEYERPLKLKAKKQGQSYGPSYTTSQKVYVNNQHPVLSSPASPTYPVDSTYGQQSALKNTEAVDITITVTAAGPNAVYQYSSPSGNLEAPGGVNWNAYSETISAQRKSTASDGFSNNFKLEVTRTANGTTNSLTKNVFLYNNPPVIDITSNNLNRMRSGGNDGTSAKSYTISIASSQPLITAPTLTAPEGNLGSFTGSSANYTGTMQVHDDDDKGTFTYTSLEAVNTAGVQTQIINSGANYELGGFVSRTVNLLPGTDSAQINVAWETYSKLSLTWSAGVSLSRAPAGTTTVQTGKWCILDQTTSPGTPGGPITIKILDFAAASNWTQPSTLTIQEAV